MSLPRAPRWLTVTGLILPVTLGFAWLLYGFAGDRHASVRLAPGTDATVEYLADAAPGMTCAEVARLSAERWRAPGVRQMGAPVGRPLWARITLRNRGEQPLHGVLLNDYLFTDRGELYWSDATGSGVPADGEWRSSRSGEAVPASEKAIPGRDMVFAVDLPAGGERSLYLRLEDRFSPGASLRWWPDATAYFTARGRAWLAEGIYFGVVLGLLGYNTLLWIRLRHSAIGYYVRYVAMAAAFMLVVRALVPEAGGILASPALEAGLTLTIAGAGYFLTRFAWAFLDLPERLPRAARFTRALSLVLALAAGGALFTPWLAHPFPFAVAVFANTATHVALGVIAIVAWRAGVWQARFFVLAFGFLFAAALVSVVSWTTRFVTDSSIGILMIGSVLEMLLLSLAVAERFARAQQQLVEQTEQRRAIEEAYADELAEEVRERTLELEQANVEKDRMLAVIGHDLRSPLTGLMRTADETPGDFARDTARTGRALLLMIEDLVLWARLRAGSRVVAVHAASAVMTPAVALHRSLAERGGTELLLDVPDELRVETDLVLAQTLVRNLVANALKFARTRVVLRAEALAGGGVRFSVGNDGPALSAEVAARIAADEDGPMTATGGLGLRLCREICRALGMRLEARVASEGGTEFGFIIRAVSTTAAVPA